jgi:histidyl-tRNA synthetase
MDLSTRPYKGARDFYPEDERIQKYIFKTWRYVAEKYGYEEYDAPILELSEIFEAKSGDELVNEQTYFFIDRGGRKVTIRPEMTPTISRMVAGKRQELAYPLRWYSIPNLWRYERPQKGRLREHWQLNVDIFGVSTVDAEVEVILLAADIMKEFGAEDEQYSIKLNSRKLTSLIMADFLELDSTQSRMMIKLLDRKDRIPDDTFFGEATSILDSPKEDESLKKLKVLTNAKSMADLPENLLDSTPVKQVQLLFTRLKENHIDNAVFDVFLVRGFEYYTDIVFELFDNHPENSRALFGGGRYDGLVSLFGVEELPTVGFGMGDVMMLEFLKAHKLLPDLISETDIYIVVVGGVLREAQGVASLLRQQGINVAVELTSKKTDKQIKTAVKKDIPFALFIGEEELSSEKFQLKDLKSQKEDRLSLEKIVETVMTFRKKNN